MSTHEKGLQQVANISNPGAGHASPVAFVSESRFAHFTRRGVSELLCKRGGLQLTEMRSPN